MIALIPSAISSTLSANGKNASECQNSTIQTVLSLLDSNAERKLHGWSAGPAPKVILSLVMMIPLDLTYFEDFQGELHSPPTLARTVDAQSQPASPLGLPPPRPDSCTKRPPTTPVNSFSTSLAS